MSVILGMEFPIASRPHRCDYCGQLIPVGQRYKRWAWVESGSADTCKAHIACDDVARDMARIMGHGDQWEVSPDVFQEWKGWVTDPVEALAVLGAAWQPGELERVTALVMG